LARTESRPGGASKVLSNPSDDLKLSYQDQTPRFVFSSPEELLQRLSSGQFEDVSLFDLRVQAEYFGLVRESEYPYSIFSSRAILYPHQVGVVHKVLTDCKHGALLADEVGLGKTVEAGMILKELACRQRARRVLILAPSTLLTKWSQELENRFGERCVIYDSKTRTYLNRRFENIWEANSRIICSIDTAKQARYRRNLTRVNWDLVIVDEAHCLRNASTENNKLIRALSKKIILLLTATPMHNSIYELYNLVSLIDQVLGPPESFSMRFLEGSNGLALKNADELRHRLQAVMIRNLKKNVYLGINRKVVGRVGETLRFNLTSKERHLYDEVSFYASGEYLKAIKANDAARGFLLILMQRMVCSSSFAIRDCLKRRIKKIEWLIRQSMMSECTSTCEDSDEHTPGKLSSSGSGALGKLFQRVDRGAPASLKHNPKIYNIELEMLKHLHDLAIGINANAKGERLLEAIGKLLTEEPDAKILIFTGFRSTQAYLVRLLHSRGYGVIYLNGSMTREEKDSACTAWHDDARNRIMVSTEVGGEGKDFQFCHILFNYDLPWNPMRVEQRIGRLDRIGQEHTVRIFNLATIDTVEEHVLDLLDDKIGLFRNVIGEVDLILGELVRAEGQSFQQVIMRIHAQAVTMEAEEERGRFRQLATKIEAAKRAFEDGITKMDKSVWSNMDLSVWNEVMGSELKHNIRDDQEKLRQFFLEFLNAYGSTPVLRGKDVFSFHVPEALANGIDDLERSGVTATFEASIAQRNPGLTLIGFGSKLLSAVIDKSRSRGFCTKKDFVIKRDHVVDKTDVTELLNFNFKVSIDGLVSEEQLVPLTLSIRDGSSQELPEEILRSRGVDYTGEVKVDHEHLVSLYGLALEAMQLKIRGWIEEVRRKCQLQYRKEETSINEYYIETDDAFRNQEHILQERCGDVIRRKGEAQSFAAIAELELDYMRLHNQLMRLRRANRRKMAEFSEAWYRDRRQLNERCSITVMITPINVAYIHLSISD